MANSEKDQLIGIVENSSESANVDFKKTSKYILSNASVKTDCGAQHDQADLLEDIVAFANNKDFDDKYIIYGVELIGLNKIYHGVNLSDLRDQANIQDLIEKCIDGELSVDLKSVEVKGKTIAILHIHNCNNRPYLLKNLRSHCNPEIRAMDQEKKQWIRKGSKKEEMTHDELIDLYRNPVFSASLVSFTFDNDSKLLTIPCDHDFDSEYNQVEKKKKHDEEEQRKMEEQRKFEEMIERSAGNQENSKIVKQDDSAVKILEDTNSNVNGIIKMISMCPNVFGNTLLESHDRGIISISEIPYPDEEQYDMYINHGHNINFKITNANQEIGLDNVRVKIEFSSNVMVCETKPYKGTSSFVFGYPKVRHDGGKTTITYDTIRHLSNNHSCRMSDDGIYIYVDGFFAGKKIPVKVIINTEGHKEIERELTIDVMP